MPIDPDGEGSWLSINDSAIVFALLNFYEKEKPITDAADNFISRGQIIKSLAFCQNEQAILSAVNKLELNRFQAFKLLIFSSSNYQQLIWDSEQFQQSKKQPLVTSSGFETSKIIHEKHSDFADVAIKNVQQQLSLHRSHQPDKGPYSICLHHDYAKTVSLSHLKITSDRVYYDYWDGSPCAAKTPTSLSLVRLS